MTWDSVIQRFSMMLVPTDFCEIDALPAVTRVVEYRHSAESVLLGSIWPTINRLSHYNMSSCKPWILLFFVTYLLPRMDCFQRPTGREGSFPAQRAPTTVSKTRRYSIPVLDEWKVLPNGRLEGKVSNHPNIADGAIISTSPVSINLDNVAAAATNGNGDANAYGVVLIETQSGSQYLLRNPSTTTTTTTSVGAISGFNADYSADFPMAVATTTADNNQKVPEETKNETKNLMQKVKDAGVAGIISYAFWELGFWAVSVPVCIAAYRQVTGHWPDFSNQEDLKQLGAEAFAFVNLARFAVPLRIGLALSTTPWIQTNIVDRFSSSSSRSK